MMESVLISEHNSIPSLGHSRINNKTSQISKREFGCEMNLVYRMCNVNAP